MAVEWEKNPALQELNVTGTDLSSEALVSILTRLPNLRWLSAGFLEGFTDQVAHLHPPSGQKGGRRLGVEVMEAWMESGATHHMYHLDLNTCDILNEAVLSDFIDRHGSQLKGLNLGGHHKLTENFWGAAIPKLPNIKYPPAACRLEGMKHTLCVFQNAHYGHSSGLLRQGAGQDTRGSLHGSDMSPLPWNRSVTHEQSSPSEAG